MPYQTKDYIHLPNPDHPESDFRLNNKGQLNIIGTINFGAGVEARLGLLKGSGKNEVVVYLFDTNKFTNETAQAWLDKHKEEVEKTMNQSKILNKTFKFTMPLQKGYDGDDGYYHLAFAISSMDPDLQGDQMTENAMEEMLEQAKSITIDDEHLPGLKKTLGPVVDAWLDEMKVLWVDLRVRKKWEDDIRDLVDSGTPLGGSITGKSTRILPSENKSLNLIDGVRLFKAALTTTPANWAIRGTAQEVKSGCPGSMCTQIMKSLGIENMEVKNVTRNENDSYEALRDKVRAAVNAKFTIGDKTKYWVKQTWPDAVLVENYDEDLLYEISYTINEAGEVELGEPVEVETQYVEKKMEFYNSMLKDVQNKPNGGGNLTKNEETIPEGMDEKFVDKIKTLGDEGKQFLKGLLGVDDPKDPEGEPGDPGGNPETGGVDVNKTMMSKEDVQKMLDERDSKFEKTLKEKDEKIKSLEKTVNTREDTISKQEHGDLVSKAIKKTNDLGFEEIKTEKDLLKHLQEEEEFTEDELEKDPDGCIKTAMRGWKIAAKRTPAGSLPNTSENEMQKIADKHAQKATEIRKSLAERGTK